MIRAGGTEASVRFDDKYGGGYMAYLEMPHQLHCLVRRRVADNTRPLLTSYSTRFGSIHGHRRTIASRWAWKTRHRLFASILVSAIPTRCREVDGLTVYRSLRRPAAPEAALRRRLDTDHVQLGQASLPPNSQFQLTSPMSKLDGNLCLAGSERTAFAERGL